MNSIEIITAFDANIGIPLVSVLEKKNLVDLVASATGYRVL